MTNIFSALLFISFAAITSPVPAQAQEIGFGGVEVGVTACDAALEMAQGNGDVTETFISAITGEAAANLRPHAFGFDFVQSGTLLCGPDKRVAAIAITIPKHRVGEIADALAAKYVQKTRNLPQLGGGSARYESKSKKTTAEVSYVHVSFDADVLIQTLDFTKMRSEYITKKRAEEKAKTKSAF